MTASLDYYYIYWIILASVPLVAWLVFYALVYLRAKKGGIEVHVNSFAITGAFLGFVSFATGWSAIESGYDWSAVTQMSFFLLFTYPVAVITPLAGFGQVVMLLGVISWAQEHDASIGFLPGYLLAWVSAALMVAGIFRPYGLSGRDAAPDLSDRLLTMTVRRPSLPWMPGNKAIAVVLSILFALAAGLFLVLRGDLDVPLLMVIALSFALYLLGAPPFARLSEQKKAGVPGNRQAPGRAAAIGGSGVAWILFVGASFAAVVVAVIVATGSFGHSGYSGEEKTSLLIEGSVAIALLVSVALLAHRRAVEPALPKNVTVATVALFSAFMLLSAVSSSYATAILSPTESLVLAALVLVGIPLLYMKGESDKGAAPG